MSNLIILKGRGGLSRKSGHMETTSYDPRIKRLEELLEISLFLSSTLELKELLKRILEVSQRVLGAEASSILLLDEASKELTFEQALGEKAEQLKPFKVKCGEGIAGKVAATGEPVLLSDVKLDPAFTGKVDAVTGFVTKSVLCVPLKVKERVIGVLELLNKQSSAESESGIFTGEDLKQAMAVANLAAVAVENAKLYMEQVKNLEEIMSLKHVKMEFLSVISHELRTPLVPIKGYVNLLQKGEQKLDGKTRRQFLEEIDNQADRLTRLIEDLFLAIDLEEVTFKLELNYVSIKDVIMHAISTRHVPKETHPIQLNVESELSLLPDTFMVQVDKSRLGHAFMHLIDNAVKFSPKGGAINCRIQQAKSPYRLEVLIQDHGIGIPSSALPKLFDMFYQVDSSSTRKFGGTGNGLYIAKKIIEAHSGSIWAESHEGLGSTFHVLLR